MHYYQEDQFKAKPLPQDEVYNPNLVQASSIKKIPHVTLDFSTKSENQRFWDGKLHGHSGNINYVHYNKHPK